MQLQVANNSLMEKSNQLMAIQRDLDLKSTMQNSHDSIRQKERVGFLDIAGLLCTTKDKLE